MRCGSMAGAEFAVVVESSVVDWICDWGID